MTSTTRCEQCGWSGGPYLSPAVADYALRKHSCDRHRDELARQARIAAAKNRAYPAHTPCQHTRTHHEEGTHAAYVLDRCRCRACTDANRVYERDRARRNAYGRSNLVDAAPVREHVHALVAAGVGARRVSGLAGISHGAMTRLMYGDKGYPPSKRVTRATADRILAVRATLDNVADRASVDGTGTRRRLQALQLLGWTQPMLAERVGVKRRALSAILNSDQPVLASTARAVRAVYDDLWSTPPVARDRFEQAGITRTQQAAQRRGWAPAMAWEDDLIDDPAATPDLGDTTPLRRTVDLEDVEHLARFGYGREHIAAHLGVQWHSVVRALTRAGRRDLLDHINHNDIQQGAA